MKDYGFYGMYIHKFIFSMDLKCIWICTTTRLWIKNGFEFIDKSINPYGNNIHLSIKYPYIHQISIYPYIPKISIYP